MYSNHLISSKSIKYLEILYREMWWPILFSLFCFFLYEHSLNKIHKDYRQLYHKLIELNKEKELALNLQQDLLQQINSQSDQMWVELTLMKGLGLVPEGYQKFLIESPK